MVHRARIRPNSSLMTPKTRSVLAAPMFFRNEASPVPLPKRPPLAMADMVRVCWKPPESAACSQTWCQAPKRLAM